MKIYSDLTKKFYEIQTDARPWMNDDTGCYDGYLVFGMVNGKDVLCSSPIYPFQLETAENSMMRHLEHFVRGYNHITHYSNFPEIQKALEAKNKK